MTAAILPGPLRARNPKHGSRALTVATMPRMVRRDAAVLGVALWAGMALCACAGAPAPVDPMAPRPVVDLARWRVDAGDRLVGHVLHKEIRDPAGPIRFFHVENPAGQWLGHVDTAGRVYRREVFATTEAFLGIYPMDKALELLYDEAGPLRMTPAPVQPPPGRRPHEAPPGAPDR